MTDQPFDPSGFFNLVSPVEVASAPQTANWDDDEDLFQRVHKSVLPEPAAVGPMVSVPASIPVVPKDDSPGTYGNLRRTSTETNLSWANRKSKTVNVFGLNDKIAGYLNALPDHFKNSLVITSGNDATHAKNSKHYHNNAVDLRYNPELHKYIANDPYARELGLRVLDPNHGTAPHTHLEFSDGGQFTPEENERMTEYREDGFVLPHFLTGAEVSGYDQYRSDTRQAISTGRMVGASPLPGIEPMQHRQPRYYGSGNLDMDEFYRRQKPITDTIPGFDPRNTEHVQQFQNRYNQQYQAATGSSYFDGSGPRSLDGKFGKYTWSAPSINQVAPQRRGVRYEKLITSLGKEYYSPIPVGNYTDFEWRETVNRMLPEKYGDVEVLRGQPYFDMYAGPHRGTTNTWRTTEDQPRTFEQLPSASRPARNMATTENQPRADEQIPPASRPVYNVSATGAPGRGMRAYSPTFAFGGASPDNPNGEEPLFIQPTEQQQFQHNLAYAPMNEIAADQQPKKKPGFDYRGISDYVHAAGNAIAGYKENQQVRADWRQGTMQAGMAQNQFGMQEAAHPNGTFSVNGGTYQGNGFSTGHYARGGAVNVGDELDLSPEEIAELRALGYQVELI